MGKILKQYVVKLTLEDYYDPLIKTLNFLKKHSDSGYFESITYNLKNILTTSQPLDVGRQKVIETMQGFVAHTVRGLNIGRHFMIDHCKEDTESIEKFLSLCSLIQGSEFLKSEEGRELEREIKRSKEFIEVCDIIKMNFLCVVCTLYGRKCIECLESFT